MARLFGLACPFVANLAALWPPLPMPALGLPTVVAGVASAMLLPETKREDLPQSMEEARKIRK